MNVPKKISFILINYNGYQYSKACIESIVKHILGIPYEILVIDNASKDDSPFLLRCYFQNRITLFANSINRGFAAACNQGIDMAAGEYLVFLNNDLIFIRNCFDKAFKLFRSNSELGMMGFQLLNPDGRPQKSQFHFPTIPRRIFQLLFKYYSEMHSKKDKISEIDEVKKVDYIKGALMIIPKRIIEENHLRFDEHYFMYHEEMDFAYQLSRCGKHCMLDSLPIAIHFGQNRESLEKPDIMKIRNTSLLYFIRKNRPYLYLIFFITIQIVVFGMKWIYHLALGHKENRIYRELVHMNLDQIKNG